MKALKLGIFYLGLPAWTFGLIDRTIAAFMNGYADAIELTQLFTALFFLVCWLILNPLWKPEP